MPGRINKNKKIYASIFLLGYLSFVLLSITHFHPFWLSNSDKTVQIASTSSVNTVNDEQGNCPVCQLYSTVNFTPIQAAASLVLMVESKINPVNETSYQTRFNDSQFLRAPPFIISLSV